ncbi:MAG: hydroxymethylpyrimidine/phosphomethylpyrimidine kinase [Candidatus Dadabacteria bacterium]|nr:MAG: hydroxymethylpyrimidine/phosphomethylpyrimidine kinase [Candidatus Dadabacteria bacterium]
MGRPGSGRGGKALCRTLAGGSGLTAALSIAAVDPSAAAGLLLDVQVFASSGLHGQGVVTALTAQAPGRARCLAVTRPTDIVAQLEAALDTWAPSAAKTGLIISVEQAGAITRVWQHANRPLVVDPVDVLSSGFDLATDPLPARVEALAPVMTLLTPNLDEAHRLLELESTAADRATREALAWALAERYHCAILLKGGHVDGADVLVHGSTLRWFEPASGPAPFSLRGSGCRLSAAITAQLARGADIQTAVMTARQLVAAALDQAQQRGGQWLAPGNLSPGDR